MGGEVMNTKPNMIEIESFLKEAKSLIRKGKYDFVPRRKNMQSLAKYGLSIIDAKEEIVELKVENYYKGPKEDFDRTRPGAIWEFKKQIDSNLFYVKLKITEINGERVLKCIGFHEDEFI